jgi:hypothetical protein
MALPGKYTARLNVGGKSFTAPIEVKLDPRVTTSMADLQKQFDLMVKVRELLGAAHAGVLEMRNVRAQMVALRKQLARNDKSKPALDLMDAIEKKMAPAEAELIEVRAKTSQDMCNYPTKLNSKVAWLDNVVDSADTAPTKQSYEFFDLMKGIADKQLAAWKEIVAKDVAALNEWMKKENIPAVALGYDRKDATKDADESDKK